MSKESKTTSSGIGLFTLIFIVFLVLKLAEIGAVKDWSWWAVTSPLWIPLAIVALVFIVLFLIAASI